MAAVAKCLLLTPDPVQRWQLPDEADVQDLDSKLFQSLEHGREEPREGFVVTVQVRIDGQHTARHVRERDLAVSAVVEVTRRGSQVF